MARKREDKSKDAPSGAAPSRRYLRYCFVVLLAGLVLLAWPSMLSFSATDPPSPQVYPPKRPVDNAVGLVGAYVAYTLRYWLGVGAYMGLLFATIAAAALMLGGRIRDVPWRVIGVVLLILATSSAAHLLNPAPAEDLAAGTVGVLGQAVGRFVLEKFSRLGSYIIIALTTLVGLLLAADSFVLKLPTLGRRIWQRRGAVTHVVNAVGQRIVKPAAPGAHPAIAAAPRAAAAGKGRPALAQAPVARGAPPTAKPPDRVSPAGPPADRPNKPLLVGKPAPPDGPATSGKKPAVVRRPDKGPQRYELPSTDLLAEPSGGYTEVLEAQAQNNKEILQQTINDFNVAAEVVGYQTGPVITLFELALSPGVKVAQIANLATDIARALAVPGVRVVPPRFGKDTIGVEIPNSDKEIVRIKELMNLAPDAEREMRLPLYLGKDAGGNPIVADLAGMPHMLIAGTTGSGKSVSINAIITSVLMTRSPRDVRLILVDPKMVEMAAFERIPHLACPIVHDMRKAEEILEWAATKMDERYELLKEANVKNIRAYNRLGADEIYKRFGVSSAEDRAGVQTQLPTYVIIVDELADLIMTSDKEVESHIIRIAQKARAVGIHMILATQRPSVNVVTGLIKANMPCRISFRVASRQESRIVLDQNGAEVLLGQGDMLFLQPGTSNLTRAQGTFVDDSEIKAVVGLLRGRGEVHYEAELMRIDSRPPGAAGERDEMFDKAVEIILSTERGSVSLLQRRLQVGYSRASRIIDQMADAGILGDYKGSQARECLMDLDQWRALQADIEADRSGASAANGQPTSV
ncbi:MAG TPA: DNA translocase FtsK 4TM domain-containing protein [Phycisphaerae bacterium]|nr:DNA translocase FtsK 4TM domain-containing protein [Phycisphaerae bacterium]